MKSMNIQNRTNNRFGRRRRNRQQQQQQQRHRLSSFVLDRHYFVIQITLLLVIIFCILAWCWIYIVNGLRRGNDVDWSNPASLSSVEVGDANHPKSFSEDIAKDVMPSTPMQEPNLSLESVVAFLMNLAELPPQQLWDTFGMDKNDGGNNDMNRYGKDPFSLHELEQGKCPSDISTAEWLPPRPWNSKEISSMFQSRAEELKSGRGAGKEEQSVMIWYEHISKAEGTTFCGLSKTNLGQSLVPRYFCMPKRLNSSDADGRVGAWSNEELIGYTKREKHLLVANEWDPFNLDKLQLSGRTLEGTKLRLTQDTDPRLLFVTTLRDPLDRLLSAYLFFGRIGETPPEFGLWMKRVFGRLGRYKVGTKAAFRSNVARYNAIVWRFSGGTLQHVGSVSSDQHQHQESEFPQPMKDEKLWKDPFETAIRALSQQDLILPMDIMTKEEGQDAMAHILGWNEVAIHEGKGKGDRESGHIVTTGKIRNSNAREYLSDEEYRFLWEANWLDNILVLWCRAVFLARLHCNDVV